MSLGLGEIIVILVIAYVVVGPEDLPKVARGLAKALRQLRRLCTGMKDCLGLDEELAEVRQAADVLDRSNLLTDDLSRIQRELQKELPDQTLFPTHKR